MEDHAALIAQIAALPGRVAALVDGLTPDQLTATPLAGEWSIAQNVHHLADSHMNAYIRSKLLLTEDNPTVRPYDQDRWAALADAQSADIRQSLALLTALHARWTHMWEHVQDAEWDRPGMHPEYGPLTLGKQLQSYVNHGNAHIEQITRTKASLAGLD